jgi:hypothetical protein
MSSMRAIDFVEKSGFLLSLRTCPFEAEAVLSLDLGILALNPDG